MRKNKIFGIIFTTMGSGMLAAPSLFDVFDDGYNEDLASMSYTARGFGESEPPVSLSSMSLPNNNVTNEFVYKKIPTHEPRPATFASESVSILPVDNDDFVAKDTGNKLHVEQTEKDLENNSVKQVSKDPVSTFSIDTDDGSYRLFNQQIKYGRKISPDLVRAEEFINAFDYGYEKPKTLEVPFSTNIEIIDAPWSDNDIIKIGIQGYEVDFDSLPPVNLVFLVDKSGSMYSELPKIKIGLKMFVGKLRDKDRISLVTYAGGTKTILSSTEVKDIDKIIDAIDSLGSGGGTNGSSGIDLAYKEAESGLIKDGVNRILLMSDGDFNVGISSQHELKQLIKEKRKSGITFSTIGFSDDSNYRGGLMESMANVGNDNYTFIGDIEDARTVFVDRFASTLVNIAKDVKTQIEFNPNVISEYRLIGYENRALRNEYFNNDSVDAGELPSGLSATLMYEVTYKGLQGLHDKLRYDIKSEEPNESATNELAYLKIRFKNPGGDVSQVIGKAVTKNMFKEEPSDETRFALSVAGFSQIIKQNDYVSNHYSIDKVISALEGISLDYNKGDSPRPDRARLHRSSALALKDTLKV